MEASEGQEHDGQETPAPDDEESVGAGPVAAEDSEDDKQTHDEKSSVPAEDSDYDKQTHDEKSSGSSGPSSGSGGALSLSPSGSAKACAKKRPIPPPPVWKERSGGQEDEVDFLDLMNSMMELDTSHTTESEEGMLSQTHGVDNGSGDSRPERSGGASRKTTAQAEAATGQTGKKGGKAGGRAGGPGASRDKPALSTCKVCGLVMEKGSAFLPKARLAHVLS